MECDTIRDLLLDGASPADTPFAAHAATCSSCLAAVERATWLDRLVLAAVVVVPPPEIAARARHAALGAVPQSPPMPTVVPRPERLSLAAYALAGLVLALSAGLLGLDPLSGLNAFFGAVLIPLRLLLTSPAVWVLPSPHDVARTGAIWLGMAVLARGLRDASLPRLGLVRRLSDHEGSDGRAGLST